MPDPHALALFILAGLALNVTPGPDMLYVIARSTGQGRRSGVMSALGIGAGTLVHVTMVAVGLSAVLQRTPAVYDALRWAGAAYLMYLGVRALTTRSSTAGPVPLQSATSWAVFRQGAVTNVLNPKVAFFILAFLPQFVDPDQGRTGLHIMILGLLFDVNGTLVNVGVAVVASSLAARFARGNVMSGVMPRVTALVFIALGVRIAFG